MRRSGVLPPEHGAWAMWVIPALSSALITRFSLTFVVFFTSFLFLYLAYRPALILLKGDKRHRSEARNLLLLSFPPALILAALLVVVYKLPLLLLFWGIELSLCVFSLKAFVGNEQRNFVNEIVILLALTLTAPAAYYSVAQRIGTDALTLFILNFLFFGGSVFYLKARLELLKANVKLKSGLSQSKSVIFYYLFLATVLLILNQFKLIEVSMLIVFLPIFVQTLIGLHSKKGKANFTHIGIVLTAQSVLFLVGLKLFWR